MSKSQFLIALETSFKNDRYVRMSRIIYYQKCTSCFTLSLLMYGLYACENVDNYRWLLYLIIPYMAILLACHAMYLFLEGSSQHYQLYIYSPILKNTKCFKYLSRQKSLSI